MKFETKKKVLKVLTIVQLVLGLIATGVCVFQLYGQPFQIKSPGLNLRTNYFQQNKYEKYVSLIINALFTFIAFVGYPGYKYDKKALVLFHAVSISIFSLAVGVFFGWAIVLKNQNFLIFAVIPFVGVIVSLFALNYLHLLWTCTEEGEVPMLKQSLVLANSNYEHL